MKPGSIFVAAVQQFAFGQRPFGPNVHDVRTKRIRGMLQHVARDIPLYRDLYQERNIRADEIQTADDLWQLPAVSKADYLRVGPDGYTHRAGDRLNLYCQTTSGSLGKSLTIYSTDSEAEYLHAALWAGWVGQGVTAADRILMMSAPYLAEKVEGFSTLFIPVQLTREETIAQFVAYRPTVIVGMVESIALLSVELAQRDIAERNQVRGIFPFGQTYSALMRKMVATGFPAAAVTELYGCAEAGWLGYACAGNCGLHVPEGRVVVQVAKTGRPDVPADPGETGEIIITSLLRRTTPFVRYRLQDAAALDLSPCSCGRTSPRIVNLEGRIQDFLVATDGRWVGPGTVVLDFIVGRPTILDHRVVQTDREHVLVSLVLSEPLPAEDRDAIAATVRKHLGNVDVQVDTVAEIPREKSGKRRRVYRMFDLPP